ncbi:MAG: DUF4153 domain-containing protein [Bacteroidetes bacterium]|nr:DUF4153 domain-containing protein [Bacteroidota bacterium]
MKIPSLQTLFGKTLHTFLRFPFALLFSVCAASIIIYFIQGNINPEGKYHYLFNLLLTCYLGMLAFIALPVFAERMNWNKSTRVGLSLLTLAILALFYFYLPNYFAAQSTLRFALYSIALHLLISVLPFLRKNEINGFWQYNKSIFLRICLSVLYSGVLFVGLSLAIVAIDQLFKVKIDGKAYGYLWVCIASIFNTWFFLSGFPEEVANLESKRDYPKGLKIFTQYILLPLITVYLIILYSYMAKILVQKQWPDGWVSYLVLCFSIAGILSLLLIHPVREDEKNKWIPVYSRFFYVAIFPLILLLFFAIKRRISDYGITEPRYFVLLLALWLLFIASYFLFSKSKSIKLVPLTLCIIAVLSSFGPWGAFSVSEKSQQRHLKELLQKNHRLRGDKAIRSEQKIGHEDAKEISSVVSYMVETHGYQSMQDYTTISLDSLMKADSLQASKNHYEQTKKIMDVLGLSYVSKYEDIQYEHFNYFGESDTIMDVNGYELFIPNLEYNGEEVSRQHVLQSDTYTFIASSENLRIKLNAAVLEFKLKSLLKDLNTTENSNSTSVPAAKMTLDKTCTEFSARVFVKQLNGIKEDSKLKLNNYSVSIFVKKN